MGSRRQEVDFAGGFILEDRGFPWPAATSLPTRRGFLTATRRCLRRRFLHRARPPGAKAQPDQAPWHTGNVVLFDEDSCRDVCAYVKTFKPVHYYVITPSCRRFARSASQTHGGRKPGLGVAGIENGTLPTPVEWSAARKLYGAGRSGTISLSALSEARFHPSG